MPTFKTGYMDELARILKPDGCLLLSEVGQVSPPSPRPSGQKDVTDEGGTQFLRPAGPVHPVVRMVLERDVGYDQAVNKTRPEEAQSHEQGGLDAKRWLAEIVEKTGHFDVFSNVSSTDLTGQPLHPDPRSRSVNLTQTTLAQGRATPNSSALASASSFYLGSSSAIGLT